MKSSFDDVFPQWDKLEPSRLVSRDVPSHPFWSQTLTTPLGPQKGPPAASPLAGLSVAPHRKGPRSCRRRLLELWPDINRKMHQWAIFLGKKNPATIE